MSGVAFLVGFEVVGLGALVYQTVSLSSDEGPGGLSGCLETAAPSLF